MYSLQKVLQYLAQVAGAGVARQNVVAFVLASRDDVPTLLHANNENDEITVKITGGELTITIGHWTSSTLPEANGHTQRIDNPTPAQLGSQSRARLKRIIGGYEELDDEAKQAVGALTAGHIQRIAQPRDYRGSGYGGYGFLHAEMLLIDHVLHERCIPRAGLTLGVSKRLCGYCAVAMEIIRRELGVSVTAPDAHWLAYFRWRCPAILDDHAQELTRQLNSMTRSGKAFVVYSVDAKVIENTSQHYNEHLRRDVCDQNILSNKFSQQYGGSSPYREEPMDTDQRDDDEGKRAGWFCLSSSCINYRRLVTPVESGGMLSRSICPFCCREVVSSDNLESRLT
jgi:hypothetical protein